jgi:hypothetical protein
LLQKYNTLGPGFSGLFVDQKWAICYTKNMIKKHPASVCCNLATLVLVGVCEFFLIFCAFYAVFG